jgi:hypothetical protein
LSRSLNSHVAHVASGHPLYELRCLLECVRGLGKHGGHIEPTVRHGLLHFQVRVTPLREYALGEVTDFIRAVLGRSIRSDH